MSDKLSKSVETVGKPWKESAYYDDAEEWTWIFWDRQTLFRQLFDRLDLASALELACGHGRHAQLAAPLCGRLVLMDIHPDNITACYSRLADARNVLYVINNGTSYQPVGDSTLTAIYCYDAMVHFDEPLVCSYLKDTARVLRPGGLGLFHHSNYSPEVERHFGLNPHARNAMTKDRFAEIAQEAGLQVVEQHVIRWGDVPDLDCVSLVRCH